MNLDKPIFNYQQAIAAVGWGPNLQILGGLLSPVIFLKSIIFLNLHLIGIALIELSQWDTLYSKDSAPGNFGFDPLGFSKNKSPADIKTMQVKEIKNGKF